MKGTGHGQKFSRKMEQAVAALLQYPTLAEAASAIGVSEVTLARWLKEQGFASAYQSARRLAVGQAVAALQQASSEAVRTLRHVMGDESISATARVTAAKTVLELALRAMEVEDLTARVEALESSLPRRRQ